MKKNFIWWLFDDNLSARIQDWEGAYNRTSLTVHTVYNIGWILTLKNKISNRKAQQLREKNPDRPMTRASEKTNNKFCVLWASYLTSLTVHTVYILDGFWPCKRKSVAGKLREKTQPDPRPTAFNGNRVRIKVSRSVWRLEYWGHRDRNCFFWVKSSHPCWGLKTQCPQFYAYFYIL